jgi:tape measure domain-containing protein
MSDVTVQIAAKDINLESTLKGIQNDLKGLATGAKSSTAIADKSFASLAKSGAAIGVGIAASMGAIKAAFAALEGTLSGFGKAINLAADWQQMEVSFNTLIGNSKLAKGFLEDLKSFAATTPFSIAGLGDASKTLLAFGQSSSEVIPTLKMLGDVAMGNEERLQSLARAFGKVQSQGKLTGEELNMMIDAGFNPLKEISEMTGKSIAELRKDMEKGAISADMVTEAFKRATSEGGQFFGMTAAQGKTFNGVMSTMKDAIDEAFRKLGSPIIDVLTPIITKWTANLEKISPIFSIIGDAISGAITWFDQWITKTFKVNEAIGNIEQALKGIATGQTGAALENIFLSMQMWAKSTANEIYSQLIAAFQTAVQFVGEMFSSNGALVKTIFGTFEMLGQRITASISRGLADALSGSILTDGIASKLNEAANAANQSANKIEDELKGAAGRIGDQFSKAGRALPDAFTENYGKVPPLFNDLNQLQQRIDDNNKKIAQSAEQYVAVNNEDLEIERAKAAEVLKVAKANLERAKSAQDELQIKREQVVKELELTEAKKSGNKELYQKLQWEAEYEKKLAALLPLYQGNEKAAEAIAKRHADAVAPLQTIGGLLNEISGKKVDPFEDATASSVKARILREEIEAIEKKLDVTLGSNRDWRGLADIFGVDTFGRSVNEVLTDVRNKIGDFKDMPAEMLVELKEIGVEKFMEKYAKLKSEPPIDLDVNVDSESVTNAQKKVDEAQEKLDALGESNTVITADIDTDPMTKALNEIENKKIPVTVKADPGHLQDQIAQTKLDLQNSFTGGDASGGDGGEGGEGGEGGAAFGDDEKGEEKNPIESIVLHLETIVKNWPVAILA